MHERLLMVRAIWEGFVVAFLAMGAALVLGSFVPVLRSPLALTVVGVAAGLAWTVRAELAEPRHRMRILAVPAAIAAITLAMSISPSYFPF